MLFAKDTHKLPSLTFLFMQVMNVALSCKYAFVFCSSKRVRVDFSVFVCVVFPSLLFDLFASTAVRTKKICLKYCWLFLRARRIPAMKESEQGGGDRSFQPHSFANISKPLLWP